MKFYFSVPKCFSIICNRSHQFQCIFMLDCWCFLIVSISTYFVHFLLFFFCRYLRRVLISFYWNSFNRQYPSYFLSGFWPPINLNYECYLTAHFPAHSSAGVLFSLFKRFQHGRLYTGHKIKKGKEWAARTTPILYFSLPLGSQLNIWANLRTRVPRLMFFFFFWIA